MEKGRTYISDTGYRLLFKREQCGYYLPIYRWFQNQPELLPIFRRRGMRGRA